MTRVAREKGSRRDPYPPTTVSLLTNPRWPFRSAKTTLSGEDIPRSGLLGWVRRTCRAIPRVEIASLEAPFISVTDRRQDAPQRDVPAIALCARATVGTPTRSANAATLTNTLVRVIPMPPLTVIRFTTGQRE